MTTHLVDTSVLTRLAVPQVRIALQPLINNVALARCILTDLEIGFSASNAGEWDRLQSNLARMQRVDLTPQVVDRARSLQRALASAGLKGRKVPDLLIAASAELANLVLLHYDEDFELIASISGQQHQWVVPRGSVA
ncbi:MAG TPA: PIN domain-containing protein [Chloroflexota bacterium]|nr:PIN domain-containing protein [Chloroflexota bacterium]